MPEEEINITEVASESLNSGYEMYVRITDNTMLYKVLEDHLSLEEVKLTPVFIVHDAKSYAQTVRACMKKLKEGWTDEDLEAYERRGLNPPTTLEEFLAEIYDITVPYWMIEAVDISMSGVMNIDDPFIIRKKLSEENIPSNYTFITVDSRL